jgi:hypothetical protein
VIDKIIDKFSDQVGRRSFLGKAVKAAAALALGLVGVPRASATVAYKCCNLCANSTPTCTSSCLWTWGCCFSPAAGFPNGDHTMWKCTEYYDPCVHANCPRPSVPDCAPTPGFKCSRATKVGTCA